MVAHYYFADHASGFLFQVEVGSEWGVIITKYRA